MKANIVRHLLFLPCSSSMLLFSQLHHVTWTWNTPKAGLVQKELNHMICDTRDNQ